MKRFKLVSPFKPSGDQPKAIREIVERIRAGEKHVVLLGATGTGKSVSPDTLILVERGHGPELVPIKDVVDPLIDGEGAGEGRTGGLKCLAFNPKTLEVSWFEVKGVSRHEAPSEVYEVRTPAGSVELTPDHNLWVLRDEGLVLIRTGELKPGDFIPSLKALPELKVKHPKVVDIVKILSDEPFRVIRDRGRVELPIAEAVPGRPDDRVIGLMGKSIPGVVPFGPAWARFLAFAYGSHLIHERYVNFTVPTREVKKLLEATLKELGFPLGAMRPHNIYQVASRVLASLVEHLVGRLRSTHVPRPEAFAFTEEEAKEFVRVILETHLQPNTRGLHLNLKSWGLAVTLEAALNKLGLDRFIVTKPGKRGAFYRLAFRGRKTLEKLLELPVSDRVKKALTKALEGEPEEYEPVPIPGMALRRKRREMGLLQRDVAAESGVSVAFVSHLETGRTHLVRESFEGLKKFLPEPLDKLDNLRWLKVSSIKKKRPSYKFVYDLSVPGVETFLAGYPGIFVHNTFTIANVIAELQRPTLIISHNKTLAAQLYGELRNFFLRMR